MQTILQKVWKELTEGKSAIRQWSVTEKQFNFQLGKRLAEAQERAGLDDYELAGQAKCNAKEIPAYRAGRAPRIYRLSLLAQALNVSADWLLGLDD